MAIWPFRSKSLKTEFEVSANDSTPAQSSRLLRAMKYSWNNPLKAARNFAIATAALTVVLPAAARVGYVEYFKKDYDCKISDKDPIKVKPYADQTFKEFWNFPLGYMLGLRDTWLNDQI